MGITIAVQLGIGGIHFWNHCGRNAEGSFTQ